MASKKIIRFPLPSLRTPCRPVGFPLSAELLEHIGDLKDTLAATPHGVALASNQILPSGHRVFVVRQPSRLPEVVINPTYTPNREFVQTEMEGCLSIPELSLMKERALRAAVTYQDESGNSHTTVVSGLDARIVQHECDHLDGKLLVDYADAKTRARVKVQAINNRKKGH